MSKGGNEALEQWLIGRPQIIKDLARKYPPGEYRIKEGAPYGYTCPGTIVYLVSYNEGGEIRVAVMPENVLPEAMEHARRINPDFTLPDDPISAYVDPIYLESIHSPNT